MKYGHTVKYKGKYYLPGQDVPVEDDCNIGKKIVEAIAKTGEENPKKKNRSKKS